jgi:hypothetical protein
MNQVSLDRQKLAHVLEGFPSPLVAPSVMEALERFYVDLDALGRIDTETGDPLIDEITLVSLLRESVSHAVADRLVGQLKALPCSAFRVDLVRGRYSEVSWFELARQIVIFDTEPTATFAELDLVAGALPNQVARSVQERFPSLELELLEADVLAAQVVKRLEDPNQSEAALRIINRQLGWWAALTTVLMLPPAIAAARELRESGKSGVAWPLSMNVLAAAVGGWTLTVIGSCLLAPVQ